MIKKEKELPGALVEDYLWSCGEFDFDEPKWELRVRGVLVELEPRPLEVLSLLLRHAGEVVTKEEFVEAIWPGAVAGDKALTNAVTKLRKAVGDEAQAVIETVPKIGYRFAAAITRKLVGRRQAPRLALKEGDTVPRREQWRLLRALDISARSEIWLAEHTRTREKRVFKFSPDGAGLSALKREATLARVLAETLGPRPDLVRVLEWNFEEPPYFLECEYGGQDWLAWAQAQGGLERVPLAQRLALFVQAARAVAAAHDVGVLHKDIKPSNLLIEQGRDGAWQLRLTDFGSGRLLDPALLAELGVTRMGFTQTVNLGADSLSGTPLYLAPELLSGQPPTQAADVYALGVLLYQVVVGDLKKPITPGWEAEVADPLLRADIAAAADGNPAARLKSAHLLVERLETLERRRAEALQAQTQARRTQELTQAVERARLRRPWLAAAGTALVAGLLLSTFFYVRAESARRAAEAQRQQAQAINRFLDRDVMAQADPNIGGRGDVTVLEAVRKASARIDERFSAEPAIAASLHQTVGSAYQTMTEWSPAESELRRAAEEDLQAYGPGSAQELGARLRLAEVMGAAGKREEAQREFAAAQAGIAALSPAQPRLELLALVTRMTLDSSTGDYQLAKKRSAEVLALADRIQARDPALLAEDEELILQTRIMHAFYLAQTDERTEAERQLRALQQTTAHQLGEHHPLVLKVRYYLAQTLLLEKPWEDDPARKARLLDEAQQILAALGPDVDSLLGPKSPLAAGVLEELGSVYEARGDWFHAIQYYDQVYRLFHDKYGDTNSKTVILMDTLGGSYERYGDVAAAIHWFGRARRYAIGLMGQSTLQLVDYQLARADMEAGHCADAAPLVAGLHPEAIDQADPRKDWAGKMRVLQGQQQLCDGQYEQARQTLEEGIAKLLLIHPEGGWTVDQARLWLGRAQAHGGVPPMPPAPPAPVTEAEPA